VSASSGNGRKLNRPCLNVEGTVEVNVEATVEKRKRTTTTESEAALKPETKRLHRPHTLQDLLNPCHDTSVDVASTTAHRKPDSHRPSKIQPPIAEIQPPTDTQPPFATRPVESLESNAIRALKVQYRTPKEYSQQHDLGSLASEWNHAQSLGDTVVKYEACGWLEVLLPGGTSWLIAILTGLLMPVYEEFSVLAVSSQIRSYDG
jgi:hypothetical protein